jgi:hypothetical protein
MSMLSFDPATATEGLLGSTATAGSFCLFCENGDVGLPTVTNESPLGAAPAETGSASAKAAVTAVNPAIEVRRLSTGSPLAAVDILAAAYPWLGVTET